MPALSIGSMRDYLGKSVSSMNQNKLNGLLAEIDFREYLSQMGFQDRVSVGGWIARSRGVNVFGDNTIVMFPETMRPGTDYGQIRELPNPTHGLHTICSTFHQLGIRSYFCAPILNINNNAESISWKSVQLGLPTEQSYEDFPDNIEGFIRRERNYNFLRYHADLVSEIPALKLPEEFTKENLRVSFQNRIMAEISDIDGILWGNQFTYPLEIKEKTPAMDKEMGEYFGLDVGPFVKLAFYAARRGNMHSIFIVKEIDNTTDRNLVNWWFITFEHLALFASWVSRGGGTNMQGGGSTVVRIPINQFTALNANTLAEL